MLPSTGMKQRAISCRINPRIQFNGIHRFDLWEEIHSSSFFTTAVQHRSLREGASLANHLGQSSSTYSTQADNILCFLQVGKLIYGVPLPIILSILSRATGTMKLDILPLTLVEADPGKTQILC